MTETGSHDIGRQIWQRQTDLIETDRFNRDRHIWQWQTDMIGQSDMTETDRNYGDRHMIETNRFDIGIYRYRQIWHRQADMIVACKFDLDRHMW